MIGAYLDSLSVFVTAAFLIAAIVLTWLTCEWIAENWRRGIGVIGRWLLRREFKRMDRERKKHLVGDALIDAIKDRYGTANNPRTVARNYRVRAGEFYGTTQLTMVPERGESGEEDK